MSEITRGLRKVLRDLVFVGGKMAMFRPCYGNEVANALLELKAVRLTSEAWEITDFGRHLVDCQIRDNEAALTRILKWARDEVEQFRDETGEIVWTRIEANSDELLSALGDAGFEIDDNTMVIHGERVEERDE